jgi:hypothetical protein
MGKQSRSISPISKKIQKLQSVKRKSLDKVQPMPLSID